MNSKALKKTDGVSAIQSYNKYVTLKKTGYSLWSNFLWGGPMNTSNGLLNKTFLAKGRYFHVNGSTYLTLYDHNNKWKGYINALGASVASNAGGVAINYNKSVKVSRKSYPFWSSFSFSHQRGTTTKYLNKTVTAKYKYVHYNGSTYYSIYSGSKWLGYVNATATVAKKSTGLYGLNVSKLSSANQSFLKTLIAYAIPSAKKNTDYTHQFWLLRRSVSQHGEQANWRRRHTLTLGSKLIPLGRAPHIQKSLRSITTALITRCHKNFGSTPRLMHRLMTMAIIS